MGTILYIVVLVALMYFMLIRPQQKRQKETREMQESLQKGDAVVTIGGMHGVVHALDEGTVIITVDNGTKLTYDRAAIRDVKNDQ